MRRILRSILEYDLGPANPGFRSISMSVSTIGYPISFVNLGGKPTIYVEGDKDAHKANFTFWLVAVGEEPPFHAVCCGSAVFETVTGHQYVLHCYMMNEED